MAAADTLAGLLRFPRRGAGSNAERRTASWLAEDLAKAGMTSRVETFWCRPNWALAHAWHLGLALVGSLVAVGSARVGGALILVALLSLISDAITGRSLGRRLTFEHASQNVIATAKREAPLRLIITANYDAGRAGLVYRPRLRRAAAAMRERAGASALGWLAWMMLLVLWLEVTAVLRTGGAHGGAVGVAQLIPTVLLVLAVALLLEQGSAEFSPAAADNGTGVAAAVALARALAVSPPAHAQVELVLQGAGDGNAAGLRAYLRAHKSERRPANTVLLGIAACGSGTPRWWISDGQLVPVGFFGDLRRLAAELASQTGHLNARPHRGRGCSPALPARSRGLPALTIGALDEHGLAPHAHGPDDTLEHVSTPTVDQVVEFGLLLVDAIDGFLAERPAPAPTPPAPTPPAPPPPTASPSAPADRR
jgi:hypothetical protein